MDPGRRRERVMSWEKWEIQRRKRLVGSELIDTFKDIKAFQLLSSVWILSPSITLRYIRKNLFHLVTRTLWSFACLVLWPKVPVVRVTIKNPLKYSKVVTGAVFSPQLSGRQSKQLFLIQFASGVLLEKPLSLSCKRGLILAPVSPGWCEDQVRQWMQRAPVKWPAFRKGSIRIGPCWQRTTLCIVFKCHGIYFGQAGRRTQRQGSVLSEKGVDSRVTVRC